MGDIPTPALEAAAWVLVADLLLVSALLSAYAARLARKWIKGDQ